jgi:hypothetical protein
MLLVSESIEDSVEALLDTVIERCAVLVVEVGRVQDGTEDVQRRSP